MVVGEWFLEPHCLNIFCVWLLVYGCWCVVVGTSLFEHCSVRGCRCLVVGSWLLVYYCCLVVGAWSVMHGCWCMVVATGMEKRNIRILVCK